VLKKTRIKNKTEWTGFLARITITLETKAMLEKTEKKYHGYFTKSLLSFALTMKKNIYIFFLPIICSPDDASKHEPNKKTTKANTFTQRKKPHKRSC
jgi:hypothetical protein